MEDDIKRQREEELPDLNELQENLDVLSGRIAEFDHQLTVVDDELLTHKSSHDTLNASLSQCNSLLIQQTNKLAECTVCPPFYPTPIPPLLLSFIM